MTIKQFAKLASGVILALIVYALDPPPSILKWFLILLFTATGVGMAFFPFEGRPIDVWILAFFRRIYSPTQYIWRKNITNQSASAPKEAGAPAVQTTPPVVAKVPQPIINPAPPLQPITQAAAPLNIPPKTVPIFKAPEPIKATLYPPIPKPEQQKVEAKFTPSIAIPATPSLPNLIVGYVRTKEGKLIDGAILEIRDIEGNPARALKTNKLGQFLIATPLPSGDYEIETDREGFEFDIIKISLTGQILPPVEIVSR